jgi:hypothetical protein
MRAPAPRYAQQRSHGADASDIPSALYARRMNVSNSVALAATISGPAVAAVAVILTARNSRGLAKDQHEHERRQTRSERLYTSRLAPYEELLRYFAPLDASRGSH